MAYKHPQLGVALGWKHNNYPGITTYSWVLTDWPPDLGARPDDVEQAQIVADYQAYLPSDQCKDDEWQNLLSSKAGKGLKAIALVLIDKGVCTANELKVKYRSL